MNTPSNTINPVTIPAVAHRREEISVPRKYGQMSLKRLTRVHRKAVALWAHVARLPYGNEMRAKAARFVLMLSGEITRRIYSEPARCALPKKQQRALGLLPPVAAGA